MFLETDKTANTPRHEGRPELLEQKLLLRVLNLLGKNALLRKLKVLLGLGLDSVALESLIIVVERKVGRALSRGLFVWETVPPRWTICNGFSLGHLPTTVESGARMEHVRIVLLATLVHLLAFTFRSWVVRNVRLLTRLHLDSVCLPATVQQLGEVVIILNQCGDVPVVRCELLQSAPLSVLLIVMFLESVSELFESFVFAHAAREHCRVLAGLVLTEHLVDLDLA